MNKYALMLAATWTLPLALPIRAEVPTPQAKQATDNKAASQESINESINHVVGYTAWDDDFLYIGIQVNKPTVSGKNALPFSNPLEDDAVIIGLQLDNDHNAKGPTKQTVLVAVSGAGGAQLYSGADRAPLFRGFEDIQAQIEKINADKNLNPTQQEAARTAVFAKVIKFAVGSKGVLRASGNGVPGYTAEVAIPWSDLGGKPTPGRRMGFNVVAQSIIPGSPPVQSFSPQVRTADGVFSPALWAQIQFDTAPQAATGGTVTSPRLFANKPVIDGEIAPNEWNTLSSFSFGAEAATEGNVASRQRIDEARQRPVFTTQPPRPGIVLPPVTADAPLFFGGAHWPHKPQPLARQVMARYAYQYQADPRKASPTTAVTRGDGSSALAHHPLDGVGPWFSYDRIDWHRSQLRELRRTGIEVILPEYRGDTRSRHTYADKGLRVMVSALQSMRQSGQDYPLVSLYLDTTSLEAEFGEKPDLTRPEVQAALYGMIRDFYRTVPAPFRNQVTLSRNPDGLYSNIAYPIFLSSASAFTAINDGFINYIRTHFAQDFQGADLIILGDSAFKSKVTDLKLDGYFTDTRDKGFFFDQGGWIQVASVGAGYDASYQEYAPGQDSTTAPFLPRKNGDTLRKNWKSALQQNPTWVMVDGWNDYDVASEIAPTLETGYSASDITREYIRQYIGLVKRNANLLAHNVPATVQTGRSYAVTVRAVNTGIEAWSADSGSGPNAKSTPGFGVVQTMTYRWLQNGTPVQEGNLATLPGTVLSGQAVDVDMNVSTANLAPGKYTLEIFLSNTKPSNAKPSNAKTGNSGKGGKKESGEEGVVGPGNILSIPVTVQASETDNKPGSLPSFAATLLHSDLPAFVEAGSLYEATVTLRNDGAQTWHKGRGGRVTFRIFRAERDPKAGQGVSKEKAVSVSMADATAELPADVAPGQTVTVKVAVPITDAEGKPLPIWHQEDNWSYTARWEVAEKSEKTDSADITGTLTAPQPLGIVDWDFGARFISDGTPATLPTERRIPVRVSVQNTGPQTWKKDLVRLGYHWYYQDGTEFLWEDETTPIPQDVAPGQTLIDTLAWITPPPFDGTYYLVWDVKVGDKWGSTLSVSRPGDQSVRSVQVQGGRLVFADLTKAFNMDGIAEEDTPTDGDLDGKGNTLPASLLPPYATGAIVPSGLWQASDRSGPDSQRRISFRYGDKDAKAKNFIACKGQKVELSKTGIKCGQIHILATSTGKAIQTSLTLVFQEPTLQSEDLYTWSVSPWDQPSTHGDPVGFLARRVQSPGGIQNHSGALYHYTIRIKEPRNLVALQLPNAPDIKIAAITLEK